MGDDATPATNDLMGLHDDVVGELDFPQFLMQPVGKILDPAGMDAFTTGSHRSGLDPRSSAGFVWQRPLLAGEHRASGVIQELVGTHTRDSIDELAAVTDVCLGQLSDTKEPGLGGPQSGGPPELVSRCPCGVLSGGGDAGRAASRSEVVWGLVTVDGLGQAGEFAELGQSAVAVDLPAADLARAGQDDIEESAV